MAMRMRVQELEAARDREKVLINDRIEDIRMAVIATIEMIVNDLGSFRIIDPMMSTMIEKTDTNLKGIPINSSEMLRINDQLTRMQTMDTTMIERVLIDTSRTEIHTTKSTTKTMR